MIEKNELHGKAVLVALFGAPGDHLHALPALRQFRQKIGRLILNAYWRGGLVSSVYDNLGIVDKFIWLDNRQMNGWTQPQIAEYLLMKLGANTVDYYYNLNGYTGMMSTPGEWEKQPIAPMRIYQDKERIYDRYCQVLKVPKGNRPIMAFSDEEIKWAEDFMDGIGAFKLVGWQWSGSSRMKEHRNPKEVILNLLWEHEDIKIVTMGSERFATALIDHERYINLAGRIKWRQAALLTSYMTLFISPDTSIMVAAQGFEDVPKILLATTTSGKQIAFPETTIIKSTADCSPCYKVLDVCDQDNCCGKIDDQEIYQAAEHILRG
jgi:ADP-heptose:LPS heptosyltransferase